MRGYTCPVFRNLSEKWALTVQAAQPPLSRPPPQTLGVSWSLGSPHGKRAQETSDNNWGEAESEGAERDVPEPHVDKMGRPLPDAAAAGKACSFRFLGLSHSQADVSEKCRAGCLLPGSGVLKGPPGPWGRMTRVRDRRQCAGPVTHQGGVLTPGTRAKTPSAALHHTRRGERVAVSQEIPPSQNSPTAVPRRRAVARSICAKKGQKGGGRGSPRKPLALPRTLWFLPPQVMTGIQT